MIRRFHLLLYRIHRFRFNLARRDACRAQVKQYEEGR